MKKPEWVVLSLYYRYSRIAITAARFVSQWSCEMASQNEETGTGWVNLVIVAVIAWFTSDEYRN